MKTVWLATAALLAAASASAQSTIYKHVDESGRVTYSNKPMKGAAVVELEPLTTIPGAPGGAAIPAAKPAVVEKVALPVEKLQPSPGVRPVAAVLTPLPAKVAAIDPAPHRKREDERRKSLETEIASEEQAVKRVRALLVQERQNPELVAAVRAAQQAENPTPSQLAEFRANVEKASGRIRGLQATLTDHEKNIEVLQRELGALKP